MARKERNVTERKCLPWEKMGRPCCRVVRVAKEKRRRSKHQKREKKKKLALNTEKREPVSYKVFEKKAGRGGGVEKKRRVMKASRIGRSKTRKGWPRALAERLLSNLKTQK